MSTIKAEIVKIASVEKHPNADVLDICTLEGMGWQVVTGREDPLQPRYKIGDPVIYIPIDSVLGEKLEAYLFPEGSKIKPDKGRIRSIKIRQFLSQGMIIDITDELEAISPGIKKKRVGDDVTLLLGITKFEPPEPPAQMRGNAAPRREEHPLFLTYIDMENIKKFQGIFTENEPVSMTIKYHGTSVRYALLKPNKLSLWDRIKSLFGKKIGPKFYIGSRNRQLRGEEDHHKHLPTKNFYSEKLEKNVYYEAAKLYDIKSKLKEGEILYGEIVGNGIQGGGYDYGCKNGEIKFLAYDVMVNNQFLGVEEFIAWCYNRDVPRVFELYRGAFSLNEVDNHRNGYDKFLDMGVPCREGIVIKSLTGVRRVVKAISDKYYLAKNNTDFH